MKIEKRQLWDKETGKDFFPVSHTDAVLTPQGESSEVRNTRQQQAVKGGGALASASDYPFMSLGEVKTTYQLNAKLNEVYAVTNPKYQGRLKLVRDGQVLWLDQIAVDWSQGYWMQVAYGAWAPSQDGQALVHTDGGFHICWRMRNDSVQKPWVEISSQIQLKTINHQSLIGDGDITIDTEGQTISIDTELDPSSHNAIANSAVATALNGQYQDLMGQIADHLPNVKKVVYVSNDLESDPLPDTANEGDIAIGDGKVFVWDDGWVRDDETSNESFFFTYDGELWKFADGDSENLAKLGKEADTLLNPNSNNAIANSVVAQQLASLIEMHNLTQATVDLLFDWRMLNGATLLPIDGSISQPYIIQGAKYNGRGGKVLIDPESGKAILKVGNTSPVYYDKWSDDPTTGRYNHYAYGNQLVDESDSQVTRTCVYYCEESDGLHFYIVAGDELVGIPLGGGSSIMVDNELSDTSTNPVQNKAVTKAVREKGKLIRVWGDNPQASTEWQLGDLWYNDDEDELKVCTNTGAHLDFEGTDFEANALYRRMETAQWYVWDEDNIMLVELTNKEVADRAATNYTLIERLFTQLQALTARVEALEPDDPSPDPTPTVTPFDPTVGNKGVITINKDPEDITVADVTGALSLPSLIGQGQSLTTAAEAGLQEGTTNAIMDANTQILKTLASADNPCVGLKLDKVYYARITKNNHYNYASGSAVKLEKDFTIDGEVNGEAVGGLVTDGSLFYTQHSLTLNKARFSSTSTHSDAMFYIDTTPGVEQLDVKGCVFTSASSGANYFQFGSNVNLSPLDGNGYATETNCINHINVDSCQAEGHLFMQSSGLRVVKSWRITNNTFTGIKGTGMNFGVNSGTYVGYMAYMSCPMFVAGNTFQGRQGIQRNRKSGGYYCGLLAETASVYMLHNTIRDFVSGRSEYINSSGTTKKYHAWTYDAYFNTTQVYFCNNTVTNIMRFDTYRLDVGCLKQKGCCVPAEYNSGHMDILRYYKDNTFNTDAKPMQWWADRASSYVADGNDYTPEINADNALDAQKFVAVTLVWGSTFNIIGQQFLFDGNIVEANSIGGGSTGSSHWAEEAVITNNEFRADNIISEGFSLFESVSQEVLFSFRGNEIELAGNTFTALNSVIRAIYLKYYTSQGDTGPATVSMHDNIVPNSSSLRAWNAW